MKYSFFLIIWLSILVNFKTSLAQEGPVPPAVPEKAMSESKEIISAQDLSENDVRYMVYPGCEENGGEEDLKSCTDRHIQRFVGSRFNTDLGQEVGAHGRVSIITSFVIDKEGNVENVKAEGDYSTLNQEAVRVISSLPKFKPALLNGHPVKFSYRFPILFVVDDSSPTAGESVEAETSPSNIEEASSTRKEDSEQALSNFFQEVVASEDPLTKEQHQYFWKLVNQLKEEDDSLDPKEIFERKKGLVFLTGFFKRYAPLLTESAIQSVKEGKAIRTEALQDYVAKNADSSQATMLKEQEELILDRLAKGEALQLEVGKPAKIYTVEDLEKLLEEQMEILENFNAKADLLFDPQAFSGKKEK